MSQYSINPYTNVISSLIGNYKSGMITCIFGNAASGKTTCCLLSAIACAKNNGKIIYVDTESGFNPDRLSQLYYGNIIDIMDKIFIFRPKSFSEQNDAIKKLKQLCTNNSIKLIIVDTISYYYRAEKSQSPKKANSIMAAQMAELIRIARDLNKVVLVTNQVYSNINNSNINSNLNHNLELPYPKKTAFDKNKGSLSSVKHDDLRMVGGRMIENMCRVIIELKNNRFLGKSSKLTRSARLVKYKQDPLDTNYYELNKKVMFEIKEKGMFLL